MALVLVPVDEDPRPSMWVDRTLEWRDLGSGPLKAFQSQGAGLEQMRVCDAWRVRTIVYSLKTADGRFAQERRYLFGASELYFEDLRTRRAKRERAGTRN